MNESIFWYAVFTKDAELLSSKKKLFKIYSFIIFVSSKNPNLYEYIGGKLLHAQCMHVCLYEAEMRKNVKCDMRICLNGWMDELLVG